MSNEVFPTLAGLSWDSKKRPRFHTDIKRAVSGKELRGEWQAYPIYDLALQYEVLRDDLVNNELRTLMGFFLQRHGAFDNFLFEDTSDNSVTDQQFGTGNGVATQFQLIRSYGGFAEPTMNIKAITNLKVNGVAKSSPADYTVSATGMVIFTAPPANGLPVTWTGTYYFRCRFARDEAEFAQFLDDLWNLKKCELVGCLGTKI